MKFILWLLLISATGCTMTQDSDSGIDSSDVDVTVIDAEVEDANKAIASGVPGSDIWLGDLDRQGQWSIANLRNISTRPGYDNQPSFTRNGSGIYYSSIRDGNQADVYLYEPLVGAGFRFTSTAQSEFSPMRLPRGKGISVVRVEADGKQEFWGYSGQTPRRLLQQVDKIGYYTWLDGKTIAMFLVTEPATLVLATVPGGELQQIDVVPGRSLSLIPASDALSFVDKSDEKQWWISRYDRTTGEISPIAPTLPDSEDFAWTPDGELLMAQAKKIYRWKGQWQLAVDLDDKIPGGITRLRLSPDGKQIVFVAAEGGA